MRNGSRAGGLPDSSASGGISRELSLSMCSVGEEGVGEGVGVSVPVFPFSGDSVGEGEGIGVVEETGVADGEEMGVSGISSGVAEGVDSGIVSGVSSCEDCVVGKIVSRSRRGSSGVGAGVAAELLASCGGDSWAETGGGAGRTEIQG